MISRPVFSATQGGRNILLSSDKHKMGWVQQCVSHDCDKTQNMQVRTKVLQSHTEQLKYINHSQINQLLLGGNARELPCCGQLPFSHFHTPSSCLGCVYVGVPPSRKRMPRGGLVVCCSDMHSMAVPRNLPNTTQCLENSLLLTIPSDAFIGLPLQFKLDLSDLSN